MNSKGKQVIKDQQPEVQKSLPMGLYVHWPYCVSKCPYCDFNSHVTRVFSEEQYVEAICAELDYLASQNEGRDLGSLFFGGGTPSLMSPETVGAVLDHARSIFAFASDIEITLEANPSSVEASRFAALASMGINRVSLGVQAFDDEALVRLGRAHSSGEALEAISLAQNSFSRMSFDLIYGRHEQKLADWREELHRAIDLSNGHLSLYQLTIEEGTRYKNLYDRGKLDLPEDERAARFFYETREICDRAGLPAYEISNFAHPGNQSRHNLVYWRYGSYIGVGPGAHGRIVKRGQRMAVSNIRSPARWYAQVMEKGHGMEQFEALDKNQQADEILLMGMRLLEGVDLHRLAALTGCRVNPSQISKLISEGFCELVEEGRYLRATDMMGSAF